MIRIGKFDIFATYTYAQAKQNGTDDENAKIHGYVVAVMGAQARRGGGRRGGSGDALANIKQAAEKKKKTVITADNFNRQIIAKMGEFFQGTFYPTIDRLVTQGLSYDDVKRVVDIPPTFGAKITSDQFIENTSKV